MNHKLIQAVATIGCVISLISPAVTRAATFEDVGSSDRPYQNIWGARADNTGVVSFSIFPPGLTMHSFLDKDVGTPEITSTIVDPAHRRYIYFSVRIDQKTNDNFLGGPFTTKVYRYDLETGKLTRVYRQAGGSGFDFLGFVGNKLIVVNAASGDNSPGPCWWDEVLAGKTLSYINVAQPWAGIKSFTPSAKFRAQRAKALQACSGNL
jgi:hypothetical protein